MSLSLDVFHRTPEEAARHIVLGFLDEARAACDRLADPEDAEALHDFRVAIRRTRSTVRAWRKPLRGIVEKDDRRALAKLQRATGGGRDAEVALEWLAGMRDGLAEEHRSGYDLLAGQLSEHHGSSMEHAQAQVRSEFDVIEGRLRERLAAAPDAGAPDDANFGQVFVAKVRKHLKTLRKSLRRIHSIAAEDEAHAARIRGKRLRYLVEPVSAAVGAGQVVVDECKRLQDVLGDLNDTRVLRDETARRLPSVDLGPEAALDPAAGRGESPREPSTEEAGLLEITRQLERRQQKLFRRLHTRWLADDAARMTAAVDELTQRVAALASAVDEIERKFLLTGAPALPAHATTVEIEQGYLAGDGAEERVRREQRGDAVRYVHTQKFGTGLRRLERNEELDADRFETLWPLTHGRRVRKRRHVVREGERTWEIDEFLDRDLWIAEVELDDAAAEVPLPAWLAPSIEREVTEAQEYANRRLAL